MRALALAAIACLASLALTGCAVKQVRLTPSSVPLEQHATLRWRTSVELPLKLYEIDDLSADYPGIKSADYLLQPGHHVLRLLYFREEHFDQAQGQYSYRNNYFLKTDSLLALEFDAESGRTYTVNAVLVDYQAPQFIAGELELRDPGRVEVGVFDATTKERKASSTLPLRYDTSTKPGKK